MIRPRPIGLPPIAAPPFRMAPSGDTQCCPDDCAKLRADRKEVSRLQEEAVLSGEVYNDAADRNLPPGFRDVRDEDELAEMGLVLEDLEPSDSDFRAAVFRNDADGRTVVAFKGTTSMEDWKQNAIQGMGKEASYYTRAQDIAQLTSESEVGDVSFTGHSLGGGLASAAARRVGGDASTFNAAGLHPNTLKDDPGGGHIDRVYVKGDIVTITQKGFVPVAASDRDWALDPPSGVGNWFKRNAAGVGGGIVGGAGGAWVGGGVGAGVGAAGGRAAGRGVVLHLMDAVHQSLEDKAEDLDKEIKKKC